MMTMIRFVDYSRAFYQEVEKTAVPKIREGKFVQMAHGDDEYVVFCPKGLCKYHSHIVERFAEAEGLTVFMDRSRDTVEFDDAGWRIIGGGKMLIDDMNKTIGLRGSSQVYGSFERPGLKEKLAELDDFGGYEVKLTD